MRASMCPSLHTPRANLHLDALDQYELPKIKANPIVPVCTPHHAQDQAHIPFTGDTSPMNYKEQF